MNSIESKLRDRETNVKVNTSLWLFYSLDEVLMSKNKTGRKTMAGYNIAIFFSHVLSLDDRFRLTLFTHNN